MDWKKLLNDKRVGQFFGKEPSAADSRTPFERDYGRAVFSTPVRRLQDKTQVFPLEEHDAVRTRLTHSLEVSSVARSFGRQAATWLADQGFCDKQSIHDIETISATCGLIHDLGNPPFGHAGEEAIQSWAKNKIDEEVAKDPPLGNAIFDQLRDPAQKAKCEQEITDFLLWEGNAQTLRLISQLQVLADEYGINLTCATFSAARKYVVPSNKTDKRDNGDHEKSKPGFFRSEQDIVEAVSNATGTGGRRNPLTYIVEASDDIVYSTGDIEDGVKKKILGWEFLKRELRKHAGDSDKVLEKVIQDAEKKVKYTPKSREVGDDEVAQAFRSYAIAAIKDSAFERFCSAYPEIAEGEYHQELVKDPDCGASGLVRACKKVGQEFIYISQSTLKLELMGRKVIHDLMNVFWEGASLCGSEKEPKSCKRGFPSKAYKLISTNYRKVFERTLKEAILPEWYCRIQLVTDQIAGMTDTYAIKLHSRLMNG
jgi:dGTPase